MKTSIYDKLIHGSASSFNNLKRGKYQCAVLLKLSYTKSQRQIFRTLSNNCNKIIRSRIQDLKSSKFDNVSIKLNDFSTVQIRPYDNIPYEFLINSKDPASHISDTMITPRDLNIWSKNWPVSFFPHGFSKNNNCELHISLTPSILFNEYDDLLNYKNKVEVLINEFKPKLRKFNELKFKKYPVVLSRNDFKKFFLTLEINKFENNNSENFKNLNKLIKDLDHIRNPENNINSFVIGEDPSNRKIFDFLHTTIGIFDVKSFLNAKNHNYIENDDVTASDIDTVSEIDTELETDVFSIRNSELESGNNDNTESIQEFSLTDQVFKSPESDMDEYKFDDYINNIGVSEIYYLNQILLKSKKDIMENYKDSLESGNLTISNNGCDVSDEILNDLQVVPAEIQLTIGNSRLRYPLDI
ncbi:hypothetical protein B5S28_g1937 [[Candida] boidinii]|nr:hypothetical protein B5S28_g1937 [[Candida] boidinii]OWB62275.1 hypothetical protein B5S29_g3198 [[Candida] boidinii]OWB74144.1 hypothetical protein B5S31_g3925 [[Candida] boidinii]GME72129.1 unnamed protein product [[Candida] boidinii]